MSLAKCPVCQAPARIWANAPVRQSRIECYRCGEFSGDDDPLRSLQRAGWSEQQIATASGYIRRNQGLLLTSEEVERLAVLRAPSPGEKAARLLIHLGQVYPQPGLSFSAPVWDIQKAQKVARAIQILNDTAEKTSEASELTQLQWLAVASASNSDELHWLIYDYLLAQGWLSQGNSDGDVIITPHGWQEIERLQQVNLGSRIGFIAMSFRDEFVSLYESGVAPGIAAAGYEARRVDRIEHNDRIDDKIIASIKQSRFLVADFTVNRGGIYFEAGLALGLGLPVIWLVREDQADEVHFDNRQYNFIRWREGAWDELVERLRFRIEATIGPGPLAKPSGGHPSGMPGHLSGVERSEHPRNPHR